MMTDDQWYDLLESVAANLRHAGLTKKQQHEELARIVAAERERWLIAVRTNQPEFERFDDQRAAGNTCRSILQAVGIEA